MKISELFYYVPEKVFPEKKNIIIVKLIHISLRSSKQHSKKAFIIDWTYFFIDWKNKLIRNRYLHL